MHARVTTIWLPPSRLEEAVRFIGDEVVPAMAPQPGLHAIWLCADPPAGKLLAMSLWDTEDHLTATDFLYQELRAKVGSLFGGPPIDEPYEARPPEQGIHEVRYQPARPPAPAAARVARVTTAQGEPGRHYRVVDDFYEAFAYRLTDLAYSREAPLRRRPLDDPAPLVANPLPAPDLDGEEALSSRFMEALSYLNSWLISLGVLYDDSPYLRAQGSWQSSSMFELGLIIGGGTAQIQKNIIAERGLDMPREPKVASD